MEKLRIGLIGCGGMMNHHVNGLLTFDDIEIAAVADPRTERTEAMMGRTGAVRSYPSHKELFENEEKLDAVYIAVEPTAHTGIEETAIERNLPFLVEKPMTMDIDQARRIAEAAEAKKLVTCVGFQDRYLEIVDRIKEELAGMRVGLVYGTWAGGVPRVWWWMKKDTCGGQLYEQNIHLVDLLRYFFGEAESVYAVCGKGLVSPHEFPDTLPAYDTDDFSTALFTFKNGVSATLMSACYVSKEGSSVRNGLTIIGRDKSIAYELRKHVTIHTAKTETKITTAADQSIRHDRAFLDAVRAGDPAGVRSPYADAYKTLVLAGAANKSMETGTVVKL